MNALLLAFLIGWVSGPPTEVGPDGRVFDEHYYDEASMLNDKWTWIQGVAGKTYYVTDASLIFATDKPFVVIVGFSIVQLCDDVPGLTIDSPGPALIMYNQIMSMSNLVMACQVARKPRPFYPSNWFELQEASSNAIYNARWRGHQGWREE